MLRSSLLLLAGLVAAAQPGQEPAGSAPADRPSLQELLRELRGRRDAELEALAPRVHAAVQRLELLGGRKPRRAYEQALADLAAMGDVAVPLYVGYLDPGAAPVADGTTEPAAGTDAAPSAEPDARAVFLADEITGLLETLPTRCILEPLLRMADAGSPHGRLNAVRVLGTVDAREEVAPALERILLGAESPGLRAAALRSLAKLGGEQSEELLRVTLVDADEELLRSALEALTVGRVAAAATEVLALTRDTTRATAVAVELVDFFVACPDTVDEAVAMALLELVKTRKPSMTDRLAVLRRLRRVDHPRTTDVRNLLREVASGATGTEVADEARVSLSLMGDTRARRQLLAVYDQQVEKNETWAQAYQDRGSIYLRLGDFSKAQKDYREAIALLQDKNQPTRDAWIELARCCALDGKLKIAADALRSATLTRERLLQLRDDPDFAELADSRHGKVFPGE